ncbi:unnamed protein product [Lymnaea stagnalis]|uniref:Uncharacterized protein n=1 Tax=Lymnaea stagnalis TaxID=6523 RepID=A0AAV2H5L5_LYMST
MMSLMFIYVYKMAYFAEIQFELWDEQDVANWLKGLDDAVHEYIPNFVQEQVDGKKLMMLTHSDLDKLWVSKLGHQELVLEAVDLLKSLRYTIETENLQHLALQLGCKARSLHNDILAHNNENDPNRANVQHLKQRRQLSISTLSSVCDIMSTLKNLTSWLDRAPFETIHGISLLRNSLVKLGLELVTVSQKESGITEVENAIVKTCQGMTEFCDELVVNMKESLVVQPAFLEMAIIRKKPGDELGMNIQSSYYGCHVIGCIKDTSPAHLCSKIEKGDEVLQVNNQTVLGWQLAKLVAALKEKPKEVTMLLKKRPRHTTPYGNYPNRRQMANRHVPSVATLPKTMKKRRSKDGEKPQRPTLEEYVTSSVPTGDIYITKESPEDIVDGNDTDNDVFRSGSESPQFTLPVIVDAKQRRATVSGGSPTFERPSLVVEDLDPAPLRPKSQAVIVTEKDAAMASMKEAEKLRQNVLSKEKKKPNVFEDPGVKRLGSMLQVLGNVLSTDDVTKSEEFFLDTQFTVKQDIFLDSPTPPQTKADNPECDPALNHNSSSVKNLNTLGVAAGDILNSGDAEAPESLEAAHKESEVKGQEFIITKPTPVNRESAARSRQQKIISTEIAGNAARSDAPQLMRIKRLDSEQINQLESKMSSDDEVFKTEKHVGFAEDTSDNEKKKIFHNVVIGGVLQKIPANTVMLHSCISPPVKLRGKSTTKTKLDRRISCKDLGKGECEGWLYKKKQKSGTLSKHWDKRWCVLKDGHLFYYKHKDDQKAEGVIVLPAFFVSPAPNLKTKKFAFKIHNGGTAFYFASERQDDMGKWMNKMGLAAINYKTEVKQEGTTSTGVTIKPEKASALATENKHVYYSESEGDEDDLSRKWEGSTASINSINSSPMSSPVLKRFNLEQVQKSVGASTEELHAMLRSIENQDLTIDGKNKIKQRQSQITPLINLHEVADPAELERMRKLHSLQRTLKAKEMELKQIESLMSKQGVSPSELRDFIETHSLDIQPK